MKIPVFDAHCDTILEAKDKNCGIRENTLHVDLKRGMKYSPYAQVFAVFTRPVQSWTDLDFSKDWPAEVLSQIGNELLEFLLSEFEKNSDILAHCLSTKDVKSAAENEKVAALIAIEGAELIGSDIEGLENAYKKGVRLINLCWNYDNPLCGSANGKTKSGLTEKGRQYVRTMQELGVAVDLSHASEQTFWDVIEITTKPVIAGHSNSKAICGSPRNLTDEQFKALVKVKGAAGLNLFPNFLCDNGDASIDDAVRHIEHFLALGGENAVCLGGDLDGIEHPPKGFTGIESYAELYNDLLRRNHSEKLVQDIFYNNLFNVLEAML